VSEKLVTVASFGLAAEAELVRQMLEAEGFDAFLADAEIVSMDWLLGNAVGNVKVQVPQKQAKWALEFLAHEQLARSERPVRRSDEDENLDCLSCGEELPEWETRCPICGWSYDAED
jgi:hypothetical protein